MPGDGLTARLSKLAAACALALALAACGSAGGSSAPRLAHAAPVNGPGADYPVVIGEPYAVNGTVYAPEDVLNYDQVGFVSEDFAGGNGVSGAHHTLPLPSYVEVTSLDTGRTALVRIERRGPMAGNELVALSPGALTQLGVIEGSPVRVRRVNPPEEHRALLRAGQPAPLRMDTPMPLVEVLRRKLPSGAPVPQPVQAAAEVPAATPPLQEPATPPAPALAAGSPPPLPAFESPEQDVPARTPPAAAPAATPPAPASAVGGGFVVQAAAFSTADRAARAASALGGEVSRSGNFYRVRTGPFATRGEAEASLAKVKAAGYSDARIFTNG